MATSRLVRVVTMLLTLFGAETIHGISSARIKSSAEDHLIEDLFSNYSSMNRPLDALHERVGIQLLVTLTQLIDVDEKSQTIKSSIWVHQHDSRLAWNEADYDGSNHITIPIGILWTPDTSILNSIDNGFKGYPHVSIEGQNVHLFSNGVIKKITPLITSTPCPMDITHFPSDHHHCIIEFGLWAYGDAQAMLQIVNDSVLFENHLPNAEWDILGTEVTSVPKSFMAKNRNYTSIIATLHIKRKPLYYIVNLIIPCGLVSILTMVAFYLPSNSPDKVNLSISLLLTIYVFNLLVIDLLPVTSQQSTYLTLYLLYIMSLICVSVGLTVFVSQFYTSSTDSEPVPGWVKDLFFGRIASILHVKIIDKNATAGFKESSPQNKDETNDSLLLSSNQNCQKSPVLAYSKSLVCKQPQGRSKTRKNLYPTRTFQRGRKFREKVLLLLDKMVKRMDEIVVVVAASGDNQNKVSDEWATLAQVLDQIFLVLLFLANIIGASLALYHIT
ncbi:neuronal acetylcholine receptor subunit alpha-6-like [Glandiceps talaboti]